MANLYSFKKKTSSATMQYISGICADGCWFLYTNSGGGCNKYVCQEIAFFLKSGNSAARNRPRRFRFHLSLLQLCIRAQLQLNRHQTCEENMAQFERFDIRQYLQCYFIWAVAEYTVVRNDDPIPSPLASRS